MAISLSFPLVPVEVFPLNSVILSSETPVLTAGGPSSFLISAHWSIIRKGVADWLKNDIRVRSRRAAA